MPESPPNWIAEKVCGDTNGLAGLTAARIGHEGLVGAGGLTLTSAAFDDGDELDPCFTADEEDAVAPPVEWSDPPAGTMEMALVVEDADADAVAHWLVWGLAPQRGKLMEGELPPKAGKNARGNSEWLLPALPSDDEAHRFVFQLFALDTPVELAPGATRKALVEAMENHVIGLALLTGTYAGQDEAEEWDLED